MVKQQRRTEDSVRQGMGLAMIRFHSVHGDINAVAEMMNSLNSPGAQAAFADTWLRKAAYTLTTCWQIVYELCQLIIEQEIYLHPEWLQGQSFSTFEEYFFSRLNTSLETLVGLEETYHLFQKYKPEVIEKLALSTEEEDGEQNIDQQSLQKTVAPPSKTNIQKQREAQKSRYNDILKVRDQLRKELGREPKHREIGEILHLNRSTVSKHLRKNELKNNSKRYNCNDILKISNQLKNELGRNPTHREVGDRLGIDRSTVGKHLKKAKLKGIFPARNLASSP